MELPEVQCSYCGHPVPAQHAARSQITGAVICADCLQAVSLLHPEWQETPLPLPQSPSPHHQVDWPEYHPKELVAVLDRYVVGQKEAKEALAVAVSIHLRRLKDPGLRLRPNLLLVGPTGSGKTLMVQTLAKHLDLPVAFGDATSLTEAGYVGDDVETLLYRLYQEAGSLARAEGGIIFLDEVDKLARREGDGHRQGRDVGGEGVQRALLTLVEGTRAAVPKSVGGPKGNTEYFMMDTSRILWVFAGAFGGIEETVKARLRIGEERPVGFHAQAIPSPSLEDLYRRITPEDLVAYGMIPELVGRMGGLAVLRPLGVEDLMRILVEPEEAPIAQYRRLLAGFGVELLVPEETLKAIAEAAFRLGTGARGLHAVLSPVVRRILVEAEPGSRVVLKPHLFTP